MTYVIKKIVYYFIFALKVASNHEQTEKGARF